MGIEEKKAVSQVWNYFIKLLFVLITTLFAIVSWFVTDKLKQMEKQLDKIDKLEEKVQALNKSQIQIMTHLRIPIPDYLYTACYPQSQKDKTPIREKEDKYFIASELNKKNRFLRGKKL
jgi:hypothetical protein